MREKDNLKKGVKTKQNKGPSSSKVKKMLILKRNMSKFCEYVVFILMPPKKLGTF